MSVLEIWVAEYQERNGLLVRAENMPRFEAICEREKVGCENLGEVTGDRRFVVEDSRDGSTPEDLDLAEVLGNIPQKTFEDRRIEPGLAPLTLPAGLTVRAALERVLRLLAVGSKRFLTNKVDRSVTGPDRAPAVLRAAAGHGCGRCGDRPEPLRDERRRHRDRGAADQAARLPGGGGAHGRGRGADEPGLGEDRRDRERQVLGQLDVGAEAPRRGGGDVRRGAGDARRDGRPRDRDRRRQGQPLDGDAGRARRR